LFVTNHSLISKAIIEDSAQENAMNYFLRPRRLEKKWVLVSVIKVVPRALVGKVAPSKSLVRSALGNFTLHNGNETEARAASAPTPAAASGSPRHGRENIRPPRVPTGRAASPSSPTIPNLIDS